MKIFRVVAIVLGSLLALWLILEIGVRIYLESPLDADFYGSINRPEAQALQAEHGVRVNAGPDWIHLGWVADPERERYRIEHFTDGVWATIGSSEFGSYLHQGEGGRFRVWAEPLGSEDPTLVGEVEASRVGEIPPLQTPSIDGPWELLFLPEEHGYYINDHTIYQDADGTWRLMGITDRSEGNFDAETYFATGSSEIFPPDDGMIEEEPTPDFGDLAWAPHVIVENGVYHMYWSPHKLHHMISEDGVHWREHQVIMDAPHHKFFRDPIVLKVAEKQWLLYTTARGRYYSQIDVYQSFDLVHWQYIRTALGSGWGSERNAPFSSMESPFITAKDGRYYLTLTYNNDSFFWPGILMLFKIWPDPGSYNDTLVFHASNPYDFGEYRGRDTSPSLLTTLEAHAPEIIYHEETGEWYLTTCGWPWVATLTNGEVAVAKLRWE